MRRPHPASRRQADADVLALCEAHLAHEEALLADVLRSLRQVRAAFVQRNLGSLAALRDRQEQLARTSQEMALVRERLRASLSSLLGVPAGEVTLRGAALSLEEPARGRLLQRHACLVELVGEADRLTHHNAALLGYARAFLGSLFAGLTGSDVGAAYGPRGERREASCGSFLEARV